MTAVNFLRLGADKSCYFVAIFLKFIKKNLTQQQLNLSLVQAGLAETVQFILGKFAEETADRLANNVFVTGGLASLPGLTARLHKELQVGVGE